MKTIHNFNHQPFQNVPLQNHFIQSTNQFNSNHTNSIQKHKKPIPSYSNLNQIIESLTFPCCGQNIVKFSESKSLLPFPSLYIMPCGHNMCQNCISTILTYKTNSSISCKSLHSLGSNRECVKNYTVQEAKQLFSKNLIIEQYAKTLLEMKIWSKKFDIQTKASCKSAIKLNQKHKKESFQGQKSNLIKKTQDKVNKVYFVSPEIDSEMKQNKSSEESSGQITFNPCINLFCKRPTGALFCSEQCEQLINKLEQIRVQNIRIINNDLNANE